MLDVILVDNIFAFAFIWIDTVGFGVLCGVLGFLSGVKMLYFVYIRFILLFYMWDEFYCEAI